MNPQEAVERQGLTRNTTSSFDDHEFYLVH